MCYKMLVDRANTRPAPRAFLRKESVTTKPSTKVIAAGGVALGVALLAIGRDSQIGDLAIGCAFLAFFGLLAFVLWLRGKL